LYDIRPGNEAGLFLQPRSPHGSVAGETAYNDIIYETDEINTVDATTLHIITTVTRWTKGASRG